MNVYERIMCEGIVCDRLYVKKIYEIKLAIKG